MHVHVVGTGAGGTGCWYRPRGITRFGAPFMLRSFGLPGDALEGDFDALYAAKLLEYVRASSLDGAVILAQDDAYQEDGRVIEGFGSFHVPNSYVLGLARRHPEFLAAVSIHPARPDALEELDRCLAEGAVALKCLPNCQNIDWNRPRYTRFLERMAAARLPLLAHTGSERTIPVVDPRLADPRVLTRPLEIGVTCIAAHCGTGMMFGDPDYFGVFAEMAMKYPRLYGDNSALAALNFRLRTAALRAMTAPPLRDRILHGSDVPVLVSGALCWAFGQLGWDDYRAAAGNPNPLARDLQLKRSLGFGEATVIRAAEEVLRLPKPAA